MIPGARTETLKLKDIRDYSESLMAPLFFTSAKDGTGVKEMFFSTASMLLDQRFQSRDRGPNSAALSNHGHSVDAPFTSDLCRLMANFLGVARNLYHVLSDCRSEHQIPFLYFP